MVVLSQKKYEKPELILNPSWHVLKILTHCAIVTRRVETATNSNMATIDADVLESYKNDTAELRKTVKMLMTKNHENEKSAQKNADAIKSLTERNDVLVEQHHLMNQQAYCAKKTVNAIGFELPIASSEFGLDESERKTITDQISKANPDHRSKADLIKENHNLQQQLNVYDNRNRITNELAYRTKKDLEKQGFPAPTNSSEFNLDEPTRDRITDEVEKDHVSRYQCDSGISVSKRPRFPSHSATPDKRLKNTENSDLPEPEVQSTNTSSLQPGVFSTEFPAIVKEIYDQNQN
jgi:hypothetical protein